MTTEVVEQETSHALTAERRPLAAVLMCEAVAELADGDQPAKDKKDGRWSLNTGAEMTTYVYGVNLDKYGWPQPIRLVLDIAKAKFEKPVIPALFAHSNWSVIGNWKGSAADEKRLSADLTLYRPKDAIEAQVLPDAVKVAALIDRDHPWQCSVGAFPRKGLEGYELIKPGKTVSLNGREFSGDGEYPLYVMRAPVIYEASVVLWGADGNTGKLAASLLDPVAHLRSIHPNPDKGNAQMTTTAPPPAAPSVAARLKAMLAKYTDQADQTLVASLMADEKSDDEIEKAVHAAQLARLTAENTKLKAELAEAKKPTTEEAPTKVGKTEASAKNAPKFEPSDDEGETPKSLNEAVKLLRAEHPKASVAKLTSMAYERWDLKRPDFKLPKG